MEEVEVYNPGPTLVQAFCIGLLEEEQTAEKCKHKVCGYDPGKRACPHCEHQGWKLQWFAFCQKCKTYKPWRMGYTAPLTACKCGSPRERRHERVCSACDKMFEKAKRIGGSGPVECKRTRRFRILSPAKIANPKQEIKFAAFRADVHYQHDRTSRIKVFVASLEERKFIEGVWATNYKCVYKAEDFDISEIANINAAELIDEMWRKLL